MGLQKRISLALTVAIVLFVTVQGYVAYKSLEKQEDRLVDEIVLTETQRLIERIRSGEVLPEKESQPLRLGPNLMAWLVPAGAGESQPLPSDLVGLGDGLHLLHEGEHIYHVMIEPISQGRLVVRFDATQNEAFVYEYGRILLLTGTLCIFLGWLMSSFLAKIVVAPFRRMSERLRNWSPGETAPADAHSDEETLLLQAFDQAQRRLEESLVREREFAANARHEVRTPLAALRTDAEMVLLTESLPKSAEERLRRMIAAVDNVSTGLDSLNALSSAAPGKAEPVALAQCVDEVWQSLAHLAADARTTLVNEVPPGDVVIVDRLALLMVLRNLLRNAIEHASPGQCTVSRTAQGLRVQDDGPGIPAQHRPFIFDRYFQGRMSDAPEIRRTDKGLGLAIARQTAELRGWTLELEPSTSGGAMFVLELESRTG